MLDHDARATRRDVLKRAGAFASLATVPSILAACGGDSDDEAQTIEGIEVQSDVVVVADFGGTTREARKQVYFDPFTRETGIGVITPLFEGAKYQLMGERGRSQWDGADTPPIDALKLVRADAAQRLPSAVERSKFVFPDLRNYDSGGYTISINQGFHKDRFGGLKPSSWADVWDFDRFPGKRAMSKPFYLVEIALLADGMAPDDLYPLDFERAFAKLDQIREQTLFYETLAQGQLHLQAGDASIVQLTNGRLYPLAAEGIETVWNEALFVGANGATVPNGAPHADAMFALTQFMMDPKRQAEFSKLTGYGPANPKALELLDEAVLAQMPNSPEHLEIAVQINPAELIKQQEEYVEKTTEWLAGK